MKTTHHSLAGQLVAKVRKLWKRRRDLDRRRGRRQSFLFETLENRSLLAGDFFNPLLPMRYHGDTQFQAPTPTNDAPSYNTQSSAEGEAGEGEAATDDLVAFAKALTAAGVKMYGGAWCPNCTAQKQLFQDGGKFLNFIDVTNPDHSPNSLAQAANNTLGRDISVYPTWEFADGSFLEGQQTLAAIAAKAGIAIPQSNLPSFAPIQDVTLQSGSPLWVTLDGYDPNNTSITYTATSTNPNLVSTFIPEGDRSIRVKVDGYGDMTFHLFDSLVPRVTNHIVSLAQQGLYNNSASNPVEFYRIARSTDNSAFVIQGGPSGASSLGNFDDQFAFDLQHNRSGLLSMAKSTDDTNDAQFFVTGNPTRFLDFNHSVFGVITEGDAIRSAIQDTRSTGDGAPPVDITMNTVEVFTDTENGVLRLKAPEGMTGTSSITVTATDADGHTFSQTFNVTVVADDQNGAPFLSDISPVKITTGTSATIQLVGNDVEGNTNFFDAVKPTGVTINYTIDVNSTTGLVTVTPPAGFVGIMPVLVGVRGATSTNTADAFDTQLLNIEVAAAAPTGIDLLAASDTGSSSTDNITNASTLQFTVSGVTNGATVKLYRGGTFLGQATASGTTATVTVASAQVAQLAQGVQNITATQTVSDIESLPSSAFAITYDTTAPGAFISTPPTEARAGQLLSYNAQSADENNGVTYQLITPPAGATIDPTTGVLSWTPGNDQTGVQTFGIRVVDAAGNATTQTLNLTVAQAVPQKVRIVLTLTKPDGTALTTLKAGDNFLLKAQVMDVRQPAYGVFAAYMDVVYDSTKAMVTGPITFGSNYVTSQSGDTATPGLIDEIGGVAGSTELGIGLYDLFTVPMKATGSGMLEFTTNAADILPAHRVLVYRENVGVEPEAVTFGNASMAIDRTFDAVDDNFTAAEGSSNVVLNPLPNDAVQVGSNDVLTISAVGATSNGGTVTIAADGKSLLYSPAADFEGVETFTYTVKNQDNVTDTATIRVTVSGSNDPPTAVDDNPTINENSTNNTLDVLANDSFAPDVGENLTIISFTPGTRGGSVSIAAGSKSLVYTPPAGITGTESFTYTISDGNGGTATAIVTVNITNVNDNPIAVADAATVVEDSSDNLINVLANDSILPDVDETLSVTAVSVGNKGGTITLAPGGTGVIYTPAPNFQGVETFTYTLSDGNGGTATGTVTVTVTNTNDPPTATLDALNAFKNITTTLDVLANDSSAPDPVENLTIITITQGAHGTVAISADGKSVTYTPTTDYTGPDTFTYTIRDPGGLQSTATVNLTVLDFIPSNLSGYVFLDVNNNGAMDSGESPLSGVTLTLTGTDITNGAMNRTAQTDAAGRYDFTTLPPGNYSITQVQPAFLQDGKSVAGSQGGTVTANKISFNLDQNINGINNNFGEMGRKAELISFRDFFSSRSGSNYVLATVSSTAANYSASGAAWSGYTNGSITAASSTQLRIEFNNPQGQRVGTTLAVSDSKVILLGTEGTAKLYRLNGAPAAFNFQAVTQTQGEGEGEAYAAFYASEAEGEGWNPNHYDPLGFDASTDEQAVDQALAEVLNW